MAIRMSNGLTQKQQDFADCYVQNGNSTPRAAESGHLTLQTAYKYLALPHVKKYIEDQYNAQKKAREDALIEQYKERVARKDDKIIVLKSEIVELLWQGAQELAQKKDIIAKERYAEWRVIKEICATISSLEGYFAPGMTQNLHLSATITRDKIMQLLPQFEKNE